MTVSVELPRGVALRQGAAPAAIAVLTVAAIVAATVAAVIGTSPVLGWVVIVWWLVAPGYAIVAVSPIRGDAMRLALSPALSLAWGQLLAEAMLLIHAWSSSLAMMVTATLVFALVARRTRQAPEGWL
jgi:hypothetical protein